MAESSRPTPALGSAHGEDSHFGRSRIDAGEADRGFVGANRNQLPAEYRPREDHLPCGNDHEGDQKRPGNTQTGDRLGQAFNRLANIHSLRMGG